MNDIIDKACFNLLTLKTVSIASNIQSIGSYVFQKCSFLSEVIIDNGLKSLGASMFANTGLLVITIPSSVTLMGNNNTILKIYN